MFLTKWAVSLLYIIYILYILYNQLLEVKKFHGLVTNSCLSSTNHLKAFSTLYNYFIRARHLFFPPDIPLDNTCLAVFSSSIRTAYPNHPILGVFPIPVMDSCPYCSISSSFVLHFQISSISFLLYILLKSLISNIFRATLNSLVICYHWSDIILQIIFIAF